MTVDMNEYGKFVLISSVSAILLSIGSIRAHEVILRFRHYRIINYKVILIIIIFEFLSLALVLILFNLLDKNLKLIEYNNFTYLVFLAFSEAVKTITISIFQIQKRINVFMLYYTIINLIFALAIIATSFGSIVFQKELVFMLVIIINLLAIFPLLFNYKLEVNELNPSTINSQIGEYINFISKAWLGSLIKVGNNRIDAIIVNWLLGPESLGLYNWIKTGSAPMNVIVGQLGTKHGDEITQLSSRGPRSMLRRYIDQVNEENRTPLIVLGIAGMTIPVGLIIYQFDIVIDIGTIIFTSILIFLSQLVASAQWWTRIIALAINPTTSIVGNFIATFCISIVGPILVFLFGMIGMALAQLLRYTLISYYFKPMLVSDKID